MKKWECVTGNRVTEESGYEEFWAIEEGGLMIGNFDNHSDAQKAAAAPELIEALQDMLSGWQYIRTQHGDLYGVGWDRAEQKAVSAINKALGESC